MPIMHACVGARATEYVLTSSGQMSSSQFGQVIPVWLQQRMDAQQKDGPEACELGFWSEWKAYGVV